MAIGYRAATAAATVARCRELGYVNDVHFARDRAEKLRARGAGSLRIGADLSGRGLPEALVNTAVEESRAGLAELDWARRALGSSGAEPDQLERQRAWRLLTARGFPPEVIEDLLGDPV